MLPRTLKRLRHRRGFGIHSPWAYTFVREVLCPRRGYAYYAYCGLPRLHGHINERLLFRLIVALQPASVAVVGAAESRLGAVRTIVAVACPGCAIVDGDADLLLCFGRQAPASQSRHAIYVDRRNPAVGHITPAHRGTLFRSRHCAIFIARDVDFSCLDVPL